MSESETKHRLNELQSEAAIGSDGEVRLPHGDDGPALDELIRIRAYELYRERGGTGGDDMSDWLLAEAEFRGRLRGSAGASFDGQRAASSAPPENRA